MRKIQEEFGKDLKVEWQSFLLRPEPRENTLEEFKRYTESWKRPAGMEKGAVFRVWATEEGPPSHSFPPHQAAKVAAHLDSAAFDKFHDRLMKAYFTENRNITDIKVLRELWDELELPIEALDQFENPEILKEIITEHNAAINNGVTGVPAVFMEGLPSAIVGAQEEDVYRRLVRRALQ